MRFAALYMLFGAGLSLLFGLIMVIGAIRAKVAKRRFGEDKRVTALMTYDPAKRRAFKGVFMVLATALAFVAAARPQYGKEKQLIPATKVDIVIVLDYSKSMYAMDIEPSRTYRAKIEVGELIQALPGVRFGAVAFSGDAIGFPITSDGATIAQFFRGLEPNDMPVPGTAISRGLHTARDLLERDPKSKDHRRFVILITDGEDLQGSPRSVAASMGEEGTTIHVVQIGQAKEVQIPEIGEDGTQTGWHKNKNTGEIITTKLTPDAERQLLSIAEATPGGKVVVAQEGKTGITELLADLKESLKSGEFVEHSEDVYADVYEYPLGAAIVLLFLEALLTDAPRRKFWRRQPPTQTGRKLPFVRSAENA